MTSALMRERARFQRAREECELVLDEAPLLWILRTTEAPPAPAETPTEIPDVDTPEKTEEDEDLDEKVRRIIREVPDPTPQPGGE